MSEIIETKAALAVDESGEITGVAWVFDSPDRARDVIRKGAFAQAKAPLPMLDSHNHSQPIGTWTSIRETEHGLEVVGKLLVNDVQRAREVHALIKAGGIRGLSISGIFSEMKRVPGGIREVGAVDLHEISTVAVPSHRDAQITSIKHISNPKDISDMNEEIEIESDAEVAEDNLSETVAEMKAALTETTKAFNALKADNDDLRIKLGRPSVTTKKVDPVETETKAFGEFLKNGIVTKALSVTGDSGSKGGVLAPDAFRAVVERKLISACPFRQWARVLPTSQVSLNIPVQASNVEVSWVDENENRPETDVQFTQITLDAYWMGAKLAISNSLLQDSLIDVMPIIADDFVKAVARKEGLAFLNGTAGGKNPTGLLQNASIDVVDAASPTALDLDELLDLTVSLPDEYDNSAAFYMNKRTRNAVRKLALAVAPDAWADNLSSDTPSTLYGFDIRIIPDLDDVAAGNTPILFGDMLSTYTILDRNALSVTVNPYLLSDYNQTRINVERRVGGGVHNTEAMKFFRMAA